MFQSLLEIVHYIRNVSHSQSVLSNRLIEQAAGVAGEDLFEIGGVGTEPPHPVGNMGHVAPEVVGGEEKPIGRPLRHDALRFRVIVAAADHGGIKVAVRKLPQQIRGVRGRG